MTSLEKTSKLQDALKVFEIGITSYLSPQGNDLNKSLLTFSQTMAKPLGHKGVKWLAIHGANCYGIDKISFEERIAWVKSNSARIARIAKDPYADYWWTEAKEPFQFLAFCFEWQGYLNEGEDYKCSLPVAVDGSNNALQHFAALLRDQELGEKVNLTSSPSPKDFYQEGLTHLRNTPEINKRYRGSHPAYYWRKYLDRSLVKQPIMTYYYGVTHQGMIEQIQKASDKNKKKSPQKYVINVLSIWLSSFEKRCPDWCPL